MLVCSWNDTSGHLKNITLEVLKRNISATATYCFNTSANSSGTFYCNFSAPSNSTFVWTLRGYTSSEPSSMLLDSGSWTDGVSAMLGLTGVFIAFLIILVCSFIGVQIQNPIFAVVMTLFGTGISILLGLVNLGSGAMVLFVGLIISGGVLLYKLR